MWPAMPRRLAAVLAVLAAVVLATTPAAARGSAGFDRYVLALSWSPTYCAGDDGRRDRQQCGPGRRFAFVVHGLWPQQSRGGWPEFCPTDERWIPRRRIDAMLDIMPSSRLVIHQWRKHGACSGLGQARYFDLTRDLYRTVRIPAPYVSPAAPVVVTPRRLVDDFVAANRGLDPAMVSMDCGNRRGGRARLAELRICFSTTGAFAACGAARRGCRADEIVLPPVR